VSINPFDKAICLDDFKADLVLTGQANGSIGGTYVWSGAIVTANGNISAQGLLPGVYPLTLTYTIDNCPYSTMEIIEIFPSVLADVTAQDISCYYNTDGEIGVNPESGAAPFSLTVNNIIANQFLISGLDAGSYNIALTDANGCKYNETVLINRPENLK
jgi:hypothetical protein